MKVSELNINPKWIKQDGEFDRLGFCNIQSKGKKILSYIKSNKYIKEISDDVSCIICTPDIVDLLPHSIKGCVVCDSPEALFWQINCEYRENKKTIIGNNCEISNLAYISDKNVVIGNNVIIEEFVSIKSGVIIGDNCIIRAGAKIGGEGFQLYDDFDGNKRCAKHVGKVILENNVEIQQNSCVDKAIFSWDATVIGEGTKIDNMVHIGHCDKIGKRNIITAGVIFAGGVTTEDDIWFGINSSIRNGINIESNAFISMGCAVIKSVNENQKVRGYYAT